MAVTVEPGLNIIGWTGPLTNISGLPWKDKVNKIWEPQRVAKSWKANVISSSFNSLSQLQNGAFYLVDVHTAFTANDLIASAVAAPPPNSIPVANAGADTTITLPANSVVLQGTGVDAEGAVTYSWVQAIGPNSAAGLPSTVAQPVISNLIAGVYQFDLTVTDSAGATHTDRVVVTVNPEVINEDTAGYTALISGSYTFTDADFNASYPSTQKTGFKERNSASYVDIRTYGTTLPVVVAGSSAGDPARSAVFFLLNGVLHQRFVLTQQNTAQTYNLPLPGGTNEVRLLNGGIDGGGGAFIQGVGAGQEIRVKIPVTPAKKEVIYANSIATGVGTINYSLDSFAALRRKRLEGDWFVQMDSDGGRQLVADTVDQANSIAARLSAQLNGTTANRLIIELGENDVNNGISVAQWQTRVTNILNAIHTLRPGLPVYFMSLLREENQRDIDFRNVVKNEADARANVFWINGAGIMDPYVAADYTDGVHPTNQGAEKLEAGLFTAINNATESTAPTPTAETSASLVSVDANNDTATTLDGNGGVMRITDGNGGGAMFEQPEADKRIKVVTDADLGGRKTFFKASGNAFLTSGFALPAGDFTVNILMKALEGVDYSSGPNCMIGDSSGTIYLFAFQDRKIRLWKDANTGWGLVSPIASPMDGDKHLYFMATWRRLASSGVSQLLINGALVTEGITAAIPPTGSQFMGASGVFDFYGSIAKMDVYGSHKTDADLNLILGAWRSRYGLALAEPNLND